MSKWVDQPSLPSINEIIHIKEEITALESKMEEELKVIQQAHLRLAELTREWEERKASIAPVKRANFDILSIIFELCCEFDPRAPLRIGAVSQYWRAVVLRTPRSWRFLDATHSVDACHEVYLERSGEQDLHVHVSITNRLVPIVSAAHRIQCLALAGENWLTNTMVFPRLTRLVIWGDGPGWPDPSLITVSCFPNLRHLELRHPLDVIDACPNLPPLQSLIINVRDEDGWPQVILACKESLKSLEITVLYNGEQWDLDYINFINFPELLYLRIVGDLQIHGTWWLGWDAPALEAFIEDRTIGWNQPRILDSTTAHMRIARPLVPSTPSEVRVLQLDLAFNEFCLFLGGLNEDASKYPQLGHLEFGISKMKKSEAAEATSMLQAWDRHGLPNLLHPPKMSDRWSVEFPGENEMQCGNGMPCVNWASKH